VIVDDGSDDGSADVVRNWFAGYDGRGKIVFHPRNRGAPAAFNSGLGAASEPHICFVDADDTVDSEALVLQAALLADGPDDVVVVYGDLEHIDETGERLEGRALDWIRSIGGPYVGDVRPVLVEKGSVCPLLGTVMRTADLRRVGGFDESLRFCDWPMWLKLAPLGRFEFSGQTVGSYRQHGESMSVKSSDELDHDRLRLLGRLARDVDYRDQKAAIGTRIGRLVRSLTQGGNPPPVTTGLRIALDLRSPRLAAQVVRAGLVRSPARPDRPS
jgi:glycosyltransferase involved in cell wall biosynthesis